MEDAEQRALAAWLNARRIVWAHAPNGGHRSMSEGKRFKAMGVSAGVPDILIFDPPPHCSAQCKQDKACLRCWGQGFDNSNGKVRFDNKRPVGTAIELKRQRGGVVSDSQAAWLRALEQRGWLARVCHGAQEAVDWLTGLGY